MESAAPDPTRQAILYEHLPAVFWTTDRNLVTTWAAGGGLTTLGRSPGQRAGIDVAKDPDVSEASRLAHKRALAGESVSYETQSRGRTFQCRVEPLKDSEGRVLGVTGVALDVTERKLAEQALLANEKRLRLILERSPGAVAMLDRNMRYLMVNHRWLTDYGVKEPDVIGRSHYEIFPEIPERWRQIHRRCLAGDVEKCDEDPFPRADGTTDWVRWEIQPWRDDRGEIGGIIIFSENITARKATEEALRKTEEQLRHAQKMEAIGRLAGGVAHDFNNLLTVINGWGDMLLKELSEASPLREPVREIVNAGRRAASLTRQLLAFSRKQVLRPETLDLNTVVERLERMLERLIGEDVALVTRLKPDLDPILADPGQIDQIVMNIVVNARDAMPQGGQLTIETANVDLDEEYARTHPSARPGPHAMIAITDTGIGMDAPTRARLFEPFFTTKERGKGTGLGLSTVYGIVKQSGGTIWVYSEPGRGTTFKVYFPRAEKTELRLPTPMVKAEVSKGTGTILVVEDDTAVRALIRRVLAMGGYKVLEAPDADEAARICREHPGPIHLLLTDMVLPKADGREAAARVKTIRADIKVVFMSGYSDHAVLQHGMIEPGAAFIEKPILPDLLLSRMREWMRG